MNLEFMKQIESLADNEQNLQYMLKDILMGRTGVMELSEEIGVTSATLQAFLSNSRAVRRVNRMKMAKYCLLQEQR